ncbi:MAG: acyl-CoA dehydrogenase family protein [Alphaproteobacteria bacterium]
MLLTEQQEMMRDMARNFVRERVVPHVDDWERDEHFPMDVVREMGKLGFLGMLVPEELDGVGGDHVAYSLVLEEIAAGSGGLSTAISGHNSVGCLPILQYGTAYQQQTFLRPMARGELLGAFCLTEPHTGSDASNLKTRAVRRGNEYVLNGTKQFITSGSTADVALVLAVTDPSGGKRAISAFLVPTKTPGYIVSRREKKMGQRISDTCQILLEDVVVPVENRLGEEGQGYRIALANLESGRIGIASQAIGLARAAFEIALDYAQERESFGKRIIEHQAVAFRLAEMTARIETARQMVHHTAVLRDAGRPCIKEASIAKMIATDMGEAVCSDAIQTLGGNGYLQDYKVERIFRDVRGARIYEGTNDIQKLVISRAMLDGR